MTASATGDRAPGPGRRLLDGRAAATTCVLLAVALALSLAAARADSFPGDRGLARAINGVGDWYEPVANLTNAAPALLAVAAALAAAVLVWRRGHRDAVLVCVLVVLTRWPLSVLKPLIDRPRPTGLEVREVVHSESFPSGHVLTMALGFGLWVLLASELVPARHVSAVRAGAAAVVLLAGIARVWAGVHWPSDAVGSVLWAAVVLAAAATLRPLLRRAVGG